MTLDEKIKLYQNIKDSGSFTALGFILLNFLKFLVRFFPTIGDKYIEWRDKNLDYRIKKEGYDKTKKID